MAAAWSRQKLPWGCVGTVAAFMSVALSGCGTGGGGGRAKTSTTATTTTTTAAPARSIWEWRKDLAMGVQITYDLSGNMQHSIYGGCWRDASAETVGEQDVFQGVTFAEYSGDTGVTLFNRRQTPTKRGCLMRKSRLPIDLSQIGRIELDVKGAGPGKKAPWYSVWLAPMLYSVTDASDKAAEIDLLENYEQDGRGSDVDDVKSNFARCDPSIPGEGFTKGFCKTTDWGLDATAVDHHITLTATEQGQEGRVIVVKHCRNPVAPAKPLETCTTGDYASIKVTKPNPGVPDWFPVWDKSKAGARYGHYWLVTDLWWTSNTNFSLGLANVHFYLNNGSEWHMSLKAIPDPVGTAEVQVVV